MEADLVRWAPSAGGVAFAFLAWTYLTGLVSLAGQFRREDLPAPELIAQESLEDVLLRGASQNLLLFLVAVLVAVLFVLERYHVFWVSEDKEEKQQKALDALTERLEAGPTRPVLTWVDLVIFGLMALFLRPDLTLVLSVPVLVLVYTYWTGRVRPIGGWMPYWAFYAGVWILCLLVSTYLYPSPLQHAAVHTRAGENIDAVLVLVTDNTLIVSEDDGSYVELPLAEVESWTATAVEPNEPRSLFSVLYDSMM